jgi:hypothetical protein
MQVDFSRSELLETDPIAEPLIAGGVRCHGGFDGRGNYVSPRVRNRLPAVRNWQAQHAAQFGTPLLDIALDSWPENYPNVPQAKYLLSEGVREPVISTLTRIGTVEGFGSMIRYSTIPPLQKSFVEDLSGTATMHLAKGLYEAHARDEAGHGDEGGHKQMWFAARDVAFEHPVSEDQTEVMLQRMGIVGAGGGAGPLAAPPRTLPADIPADLELLIERMARLLLIEISAFHTFAWAEEVLSDKVLVAGEGAAARLVSYIRADETPHVEYLKTTLSEMRDRTFVGSSGRKYPGTEMIGMIWDRARAESLGVRRDQQVAVMRKEIEHALAGNPRKDDLLAELESLGAAA